MSRARARRPHPPTSVLVAVLAASVAGACRGPGGGSERFEDNTLRVSGVLQSDFDAEVDLGPASIEGESDLSSFELAFGETFFREDAYGERRKRSRVEILAGASEYGDLDAFELGMGGMLFLDRHPFVHPYVAAHTMFTFFEDVADVRVGTQLGARLGAGIEVPVNERVFVQFGVDYTLPLAAAESDTEPAFESEVEGWALRLGVGLQL